MINDGTNLMVICISQSQAEHFSRIHHFQMDMIFQRIAGAMKEVVLVVKDDVLSQGNP